MCASSNKHRYLLIVFLSFVAVRVRVKLEKCDCRLGTQESANYVCTLDKRVCCVLATHIHHLNCRAWTNVLPMRTHALQRTKARGSILIDAPSTSANFQSKNEFDKFSKKKSKVISSFACYFSRIEVCLFLSLLSPPRHVMRKSQSIHWASVNLWLVSRGATNNQNNSGLCVEISIISEMRISYALTSIMYCIKKKT